MYGISRRIAVVLLAVVTAGCNPFQTGMPDPPAGTTVNYPQPTTVDNVLSIIRLSLQTKDTPAYTERLGDTFVFVPDPVQLGSNEFASFPEIWSAVHEEAFLTGLFSNADSLSLTWSDVLTQSVGTEHHVTASYELRVWISSSPTAYVGNAEITMAEISGILYISRWRDAALSGNVQTMGLLRARLLAAG